jgi:hypothetical protein
MSDDVADSWEDLVDEVPAPAPLVAAKASPTVKAARSKSPAKRSSPAAAAVGGVKERTIVKEYDPDSMKADDPAEEKKRQVTRFFKNFCSSGSSNAKG